MPQYLQCSHNGPNDWVSSHGKRDQLSLSVCLAVEGHPIIFQCIHNKHSMMSISMPLDQAFEFLQLTVICTELPRYFVENMVLQCGPNYFSLQKNTPNHMFRMQCSGPPIS